MPIDPRNTRVSNQTKADAQELTGGGASLKPPLKTYTKSIQRAPSGGGGGRPPRTPKLPPKLPPKPSSEQYLKSNPELNRYFGGGGKPMPRMAQAPPQSGGDFYAALGGIIRAAQASNLPFVGGHPSTGGTHGPITDFAINRANAGFAQPDKMVGQISGGVDWVLREILNGIMEMGEDEDGIISPFPTPKP